MGLLNPFAKRITKLYAAAGLRKLLPSERKVSRDEAIDWLVMRAGYSRRKAAGAIDGYKESSGLWTTDGAMSLPLRPLDKHRRWWAIDG